MRLREVLKTPGGEPRLVVPAFLALVLTFVLGYAAMRVVQRALPPEQQASALAATRKFAAAEQIYVRLLKERPTGDLVLALIDNHDRAQMHALQRKLGLGVTAAGDVSNEEAVMTDEVLDDFLEHGLPPDLSRVARFFRGMRKGEVPQALRDEIVQGAQREPPLPLHNHVLAREALVKMDVPEAARLHEREGLAFPDRKEDLDQAMALYLRLEDWDHLHERLADPRVSRSVDAMIKYKVAVHDHDWGQAARHLLAAWRPDPSLTNGVMAGIAALAWGFFCARLGRLQEKPKRRLLFYLLAFGLGILSVAPTVLLIAVEEARLKLVATGDVSRDLIYFVFGVGLREEASKLLLFLPLLPLLRRWGDRLDVLVCGAMVGLGFAAEENLNYLAHGDLHTALARFLTANFFHMAMTGTLAAALDDFLRDREKHAADFTRTSLMVVGMHGGYDFLLSHEEIGGSYVAMAVFFFLAQMFLHAVDHARRKADAGLTLTQAFMLSVGVVTGTSAVYAVAAVGPAQGVIVLAEGLLGVAIIIYAFVRTLHGM